MLLLAPHVYLDIFTIWAHAFWNVHQVLTVIPARALLAIACVKLAQVLPHTVFLANHQMC